MLVRVYIDRRRVSFPSKYAKSGDYEAFVVVLYCWHQQIEAQLRGKQTKKQIRVETSAIISGD